MTRALAFASLVALVACSSPAREDPPGGNGCIPGQSIACACSNGASGAQTCESTGVFGACSCEGTGGPDAGTGGTPDAGIEATPCAKMCAHVYVDCQRQFTNTQDQPISQAGCVTLCDGGSFNQAQLSCFTTSACEADQINRCFNPGAPLCPQDADCGGRECGPDPICGTSCGACGPTQSCSTAGHCVAVHGWVKEVFNTGGPEALTLAADPVNVLRAALLGQDGQLLDVAVVGNTLKYTLIEKIGVDSFSVGQTISMKVDAQGKPSIAYTDKTTGKLKYAKLNGTSWTVEVADVNGASTEYASLALDSQGLPHIAYSEGSSKHLNHAFKDAGGTWHVEVVDTDFYAGLFAQIALDSQGHPHIATADGYRLVRHWVHDGTSWSHTDVSTEGTPKFVSFAFDPQGRPHVTWHASGLNKLRHAVLDGASWMVDDVVDYVGNGNGHNSLAIAADGTLHLAYMETGASDLKYGRKLPGSSTWAVESVDTDGFAGMDCALVLSPGGWPYVLYRTNRVNQLTMLAHDVP